MRFKKTLYAALALITITLSSTLADVAAHADPVFVDGPPDTGAHTWCVPASPAVTLHDIADDSMRRARDQTTMTRAYHDTCNGATDVKWLWAFEPNDPYYGMAVCVNWYENHRCNRYEITLNKSNIDTWTYPGSQLRKTACHELGHTLGVSHYKFSEYPGGDTSHSCMRSFEVPSPNKSWHITYGNHHVKSHINPWFS